MWIRRNNKLQSSAAGLIAAWIVLPQFSLYDIPSRSLSCILWALLLAWCGIRLYMYHNEKEENEEDGKEELMDEINEQAEKVYLQNEREFLIRGRIRLLDVVHISKWGELFLIVDVEMNSSQGEDPPSKVPKQCVLRYTQNAASEDRLEIVDRNTRDGILAIYNNVNCTQCLMKSRLLTKIEEDVNYICRHLG